MKKTVITLLWQGLLIGWLALLSGCRSLPPADERRQQTEALLAAHHWQAEILPTALYQVYSAAPLAAGPSPRLTVYLEGDGLAWTSPTTPSNNPTPLNPMALRLALADHQAAAYLARPCQYTLPEDTQCAPSDWTNRRYSPEIVSAIGQALDQLKQRYKVKQFLLVGYSGGGAIAALVAAQRPDVVGIITLAGNLDIEAWVQRNHLSPLTGSLNPADAADALRNLPQVHWSGGRDTVISPQMAASYRARFRDTSSLHLATEPTFDHACCWQTDWPARKAQSEEWLRLPQSPTH